MSEKSILAGIFRMGDQAKRNIRDLVSNPRDYLEGVAHQNNLEWKKNPDERSMGFFNPVPLGTMSPFMLRKQMKEAVEDLPNLSRRDFMKRSAGIAGGSAAASIPGAKLLQKFAPEERAVAKEVAVEAAPKHRYNSLKEYLDDVQMWAKEDFKAAELSGQGARYSKDEFAKRILLKDESMYKNTKLYTKYTDDPEIAARMSLMDDGRFSIGDGSRYDNYLKSLKDAAEKDSRAGLLDPFTDTQVTRFKDSSNAFSPQAKKEMKALKDFYGDNWTSTSNSREFRHYLDNMGVVQGPQGSNQFYWNGKTPLDTQFEHLNPKTGGYNFWDETGGHGLMDGKATKREMEEAFQSYIRDYL